MTTTWKTREGREIEIKDLDDFHLVNIISLLRRKGKPLAVAASWKWAFKALSYASTAPDGAAEAAEEEASRLLNHQCLDEMLSMELPIFGFLLAEAENRGLPLEGQKR